jgi:hypothetical protein
VIGGQMDEERIIKRIFGIKDISLQNLKGLKFHINSLPCCANSLFCDAVKSCYFTSLYTFCCSMAGDV